MVDVLPLSRAFFMSSGFIVACAPSQVLPPDPLNKDFFMASEPHSPQSGVHALCLSVLQHTTSRTPLIALSQTKAPVCPPLIQNPVYLHQSSSSSSFPSRLLKPSLVYLRTTSTQQQHPLQTQQEPGLNNDSPAPLPLLTRAFIRPPAPSLLPHRRTASTASRELPASSARRESRSRSRWRSDVCAATGPFMGSCPRTCSRRCRQPNAPLAAEKKQRLDSTRACIVQQPGGGGRCGKIWVAAREIGGKDKVAPGWP